MRARKKKAYRLHERIAQRVRTEDLTQIRRQSVLCETLELVEGTVPSGARLPPLVGSVMTVPGGGRNNRRCSRSGCEDDAEEGTWHSGQQYHIVRRGEGTGGATTCGLLWGGSASKSKSNVNELMN